MPFRKNNDKQEIVPPPPAPELPRGPRSFPIFETGPVPAWRGAVTEQLREVVNSLTWDANQEYPRANWRTVRVAVDPAGACALYLSTGGPTMHWAPSRHSVGLIDYFHGALVDHGYRAGFVLDLTPQQALITWR